MVGTDIYKQNCGFNWILKNNPKRQLVEQLDLVHKFFTIKKNTVPIMNIFSDKTTNEKELTYLCHEIQILAGPALDFFEKETITKIKDP
jgi:hypothetical protein